MVKIRNKNSLKIIEEIKELKNKTNLDYIDSILEYCEKNNIEVETISTIVKNSELLPFLQKDAESKNFLKGE